MDASRRKSTRLSPVPALTSRGQAHRFALLLITLALLSLQPARSFAQATGGNPYSVDNLVKQGLLPRPTTPEQLRNLNVLIAEQLAENRKFGSTPPAGVPSKYVDLARQQSNLFSIKWAYRGQTNPEFYLSAEYQHDRELLRQGCFPTCPPDDSTTYQNSGTAADPHALLNQLRDLAYTDMSGIMSPRRIDALAGEQEAEQLHYDGPNVIDFTHPQDAPKVDEPLVETNDPDIFPPWKGDPELDLPDKGAGATCLTVDGCTEDAQSDTPLETQDAPPANAPRTPMADAQDAPDAAADPDIDAAGRSVVDDIKDAYGYLKTRTEEGLQRARRFTRETADAIVESVPDFVAGKFDENGRYTGSLEEKIAEKLSPESGDHLPNQTIVGEFLTSFITSKVADALGQATDSMVMKALGDNASAKVEYVFRRHLLPNLPRPGELVNGLEKLLGIVQDEFFPGSAAEQAR